MSEYQATLNIKTTCPALSPVQLASYLSFNKNLKNTSTSASLTRPDPRAQPFLFIMSEESQRCDDTLESLSEWLRKPFQQNHRIDLTAENNSGTPEGVDESALLIHAGEERIQGRLLEAIDTYIQVIRLQLQRHDLGESSPSREAFERIFEILGYNPEPMWTSSDWWFNDILNMTAGPLPYVVSGTQWALTSGTIDMFQTLADYIAKWYAPSGLKCAEVLYRRILVEFYGQSSTLEDKRRAHVVKELAKIYVEVPSDFEWSPATTSIVQQGLQEVKRRSGDDELMQFYQGLGALYVSKGPEDASFDARYGEEILQRLYEIQKPVFGNSNYRTIKTVDILSCYYQREGREVQAASLIECTLRNGDTTAESDCCLLQRLERQLGKQWEGGSGSTFVEGAGDERKREAIKKAMALKKVEDTTAATSDGCFSRIHERMSLQSRLMSLLAPPWRVWEDSRLYLNDIAKIRFQPAPIAALEDYPVRVVLRNSEVSVHISPAARSLSSTSEDNKRVSELGKWVQESRFCQILKTADDGWKAIDENESSKPRCSEWEPIFEDSNAEENDMKPDMTAWDTDYVFWIFPRDLAAIEKQSMRWKYSYRKLPDRSEWMVIVGWSNRLADRGYHRSSYCLPWFPGDDLAYSINEQEDANITLVCPYIPYYGVQNLRGLTGGLTYAEFMDQLHLSPQHWDDAQRILEFKETLCRQDTVELQELPIVILDSVCHTSPEIRNNREGGCPQSIQIGANRTDGFFNNIPGGFAVTHSEGRIRGFNLVSCSWVDWKAFAVDDELLDYDYPKLTSEAGDPINCLGFIQGTWITGHLDGKFAMDKVFVVDAVFKSTKEPQVSPNFIFCEDALAESSITQCKLDSLLLVTKP